jgi:hypothetical protein
VQSLLVPLTIPDTKFITRLDIPCEVNSLQTTRVVFFVVYPLTKEFFGR